ncbi:MULTISPECIES: hypothetical protein [unclassified Nitratiruptor]|uniref:hypothetical protein n=1 Tax=unclassified Nitratiruptor TaxID=2624044 RepID=UPI00191597A0|nr:MULTISPECIES: hypothetical protein [unclassified Nitratiruptor]BCD60800.1 hypothetical protein NitYY0810_C1578 [Nitratiruptor sp. YY08-10]BCD64732.1 hypothetical protein NitYY0814_C1586 [Nitratiruptor sp. YY08-14]
MKLLLINNNPVVNRMMNIGVPKAGYELESIENVNEIPSGTYEVVIIDDDLYDENLLELIKEKIDYKKIGIIASNAKNFEDQFDFVLPKPFLPTDLVELLRKVQQEIMHTGEQEQEAPLSEEEVLEAQTSEEEKPEEVSVEEEVQEEKPAEESMQGEEEVSEIPTIQPVEREEPLVEVEEEEEEPPFVEETMEKSGVLDEEEVKKVSELLEEEPENETATDESSAEEILTHFDEEPSEELEESPALLEESEHMPKADSSTAEKMEDKSKEESVQAVAQGLEKLDIHALKTLLDGMQLDITIKISFPKE